MKRALRRLGYRSWQQFTQMHVRAYRATGGRVGRNYKGTPVALVAQIDSGAARARKRLRSRSLRETPFELDCGGLGYCSTGGSGKALERSRAFPDDFDSDTDGFGLLGVGPTGDFQLLTGAKASEIGIRRRVRRAYQERRAAILGASGLAQLRLLHDTGPHELERGRRILHDLLPGRAR